MRILIIIGFVFMANVAASNIGVKGGFGYHNEVGIPEAQRIKQAEDRIIENEQKNRIVGGVVAPINSNPFLAGLIIDLANTGGQSACGSSLLSANRLVTAAHCWFDGINIAWRFTVVLGSQYLFSGGVRIATSQVYMHPQWDSSWIANDVAMIYLPTPVGFTAAIQPVQLPSPNDLYNTFAGQWAVAAGYGKTSDSQTGITQSAIISQVNVQVISVAQCFTTFGAYIRDSNICTSGAGFVGICGGDSGGPLTLTNAFGQRILVGISSFVANTGCQLGHPSVFARVTSFQNFIYQHLF